MVNEVEDPVVGEAGARVEASFMLAVQSQAGLRDLHNEHGTRRVSGQVIPRPARHHGDVRLGLRLVIQGHRKLNPNIPAGPESTPQGLFGESDTDGMRRSLRFADDHLPREQLDPVVRQENPFLDQLVVLDPAPPTGSDSGRPHGVFSSSRHYTDRQHGSMSRSTYTLSSYTPGFFWTCEDQMEQSGATSHTCRGAIPDEPRGEDPVHL